MGRVQPLLKLSAVIGLPASYMEGYISPNIGPLDGYAAAGRAGLGRQIKRYLIGNNYGIYKAVKEEYKTRRTAPPD